MSLDEKVKNDLRNEIVEIQYQLDHAKTRLNANSNELRLVLEENLSLRFALETMYNSACSNSNSVPSKEAFILAVKALNKGY